MSITKKIIFAKSLKEPFIDFICAIGTLITIILVIELIDNSLHKNDEKIYDKLKEINNKLL